ncbi:cobalt-precorrin 5A hydrolase [Buttiauxella warmboldiae]|uniref:Cobalt-precorrin 5A hydrolase n=1 Tax=Buttiauxella warmboldiae TaxID=82993 RepID=A0A3N5DR36_9ENTR|nr:cobalt-precorrin 5A hydrolase [Buttiauxella warmboldiae]RPH28100.1 cobalt-precorrin 5A hydrolase [Buttiauxella warmboldiae]
MNTAKPEAIALFCLTPGGVALAQRLRAALPLVCFTSEKLLQPGFIPFGGSFARTVAQAFSQYPALVFIAATGIVVRVIAPLLNDKLHDPAVVVMDERAEHVISLLSGHLGGANDLTRQLAALLGADPVITTATDVNQLAALDTLAAKLDASMQDFRQAVKTVNQMLVSQQRVGLWWDGDFAPQAHEYDTRGFIPVASLDALPELDALVCVTLRDALPAQAIPLFKLVPKRVVAGIGCRRNTSLQIVAELLDQQLAENHFDPLALRAIGSVTLKQDEAALLALAKERQVPFRLFSVDQLSEHEQRFPVSAFVRETLGVGSVSQPAAWLLSHGRLVGHTLKTQGVTITLGVSDRC